MHAARHDEEMKVVGVIHLVVQRTRRAGALDISAVGLDGGDVGGCSLVEITSALINVRRHGDEVAGVGDEGCRRWALGRARSGFAEASTAWM